MADRYDRLLAVHLHILENYPYLELVSHVSVKLSGDYIVLVGTVRSHYLKQSLLAFAVHAAGSDYVRDQMKVLEVGSTEQATYSTRLDVG